MEVQFRFLTLGSRILREAEYLEHQKVPNAKLKKALLLQNIYLNGVYVNPCFYKAFLESYKQTKTLRIDFWMKLFNLYLDVPQF